MRIAVIVEFFPPKMGSDRRIYELMRRSAKKHDVHFLQIPPFRELSGVITSETYSVNMESIFIYEDIVAHRVNLPKTLKKLWQSSFILSYFLSMALIFPKVIRELKKINPNIIILNYPSVYTGIIGFFSAKILRRHCVVDFNDLIAQYTINLLRRDFPRFVDLMIILIQDFIVKNSSLVVTPTNFIKNYTLNLGFNSKKIFVVPNGVSMKIFNPEIKSEYKSKLELEDKKICLYFGRLDEWAGMKILRNVSTFFEKRRSDLIFLLVGGGQIGADFPNNVTIVNEVPHYEVPKLVTIADIVLVPFPDNLVSHAASPIKLFEAMAMGKPIIASRIRGIEEVIESGFNGVLKDPNNPIEWVEAINTLLNSNTLQNKLGKNAEESVEKYDWDLLSSRFETILLKMKK